MDKSESFNYRSLQNDSPSPWNGDFPSGFGDTDRSYAYWRQPSFNQSQHDSTSTPRPFLSRNVSCIDLPPEYDYDYDDAFFEEAKDSNKKKEISVWDCLGSVFRVIKSGNRQMKRLFLMISLNVAYSTAELGIGLFTGRVGLVSDAFHLTFGCELLTFSLFAMAVSRRKPDRVYTYGYKRLEVLAAFTNALFLLFMSFSLAVEALHAFIQDESEHKHYLIVSAVTNLLVNVIGVWFFRNYGRVNLVSVAVFLLVMPLFKATGGLLLQMAPPNVPSSAFSKCLRQVTAQEDVSEVSRACFWELVPGHTVGSICLQVRKGVDDRPILHHVHGLYHDLGIQDLTVQTDYD